MIIRSRHLAYALSAALIGFTSAAYAQGRMAAPGTETTRPQTAAVVAAADPPVGSTYVCPHPTTAAHDQYGCMPKPGGGAARAAVNNPIDPRKVR